MFDRFFKKTLTSRLDDMFKASQAKRFDIARQIYCHFKINNEELFSYDATIHTRPGRVVDSNDYIFHSSTPDIDIRQTLTILTAEVAMAARQWPELNFFRILVLNYNDAKQYLTDYKNLPQKERWLGDALKRAKNNTRDIIDVSPYLMDCKNLPEWPSWLGDAPKGYEKYTRYIINEKFEVDSWTPHHKQPLYSYNYPDFV